MMASSDIWNLTRETIGDGRLSVLAPLNDAEAVKAVLSAHGIASEVSPIDSVRYGSRGAALKAAFERTVGDYVMILAGDSVANVEKVPVFFKKMVTKGADVVVGSKRHVGSDGRYPWHRRFLSAVYHTGVRWLFGIKVTDSQTGMWLFRREMLGYVLKRALVKEHAFDLEMLAIAAGHGAEIAEAPVALGEGVHFGVPTRLLVRNLVNDTLAIFYRLRILHYYEKCLVPKKLDHDPLVSVVIACPKASWMLDECLGGIARQTYPNYEVIVLPDEGEASENGKVRFLPTGKVRPAEKRNLGIKAAKGEIIAFIDDDAYPDSHWLEYAVKYFGESSIGAVGGPGVTPPEDGFLSRLGGRVYDSYLVSGNYRYRYKAGGTRMDVEDYPSCNLFVRRDLLEKIGGYRTDFWPGEDTLLCKDIIDNWKRIIYDPWVIVYHHRRPLFLPHLRQLGRYGFHRGYFCKRYPSNSLRASYFVPSAFVVYLALLAVAAFLVRGWQLCFAAAPLAVYLIVVLITSFSWKPHHWLITALGVFLSHVCYGVRFVQGLCAGKAPCEYIGKDHSCTQC